MKFVLEEVDSSWWPIFERHSDSINSILEQLEGVNFTPDRSDIFRAFRKPREDVKVVIFGQDPYPGEGVADGYAFSSFSHNPIPASLRNIFKELSDDLSIDCPSNPDLTRWADNGVLLLNRSLTTSVGERNAHLKKGWNAFTEEIARELAHLQVVAILWGNFAKELSPLFLYSVESVHPSPLSARNGFFGSKPFSRVNHLLRELGRSEVDWRL